MAAGVDALRHEGVDVQRVLLTGRDACPEWDAVEQVVSAGPFVDPSVDEVKALRDGATRVVRL